MNAPSRNVEMVDSAYKLSFTAGGLLYTESVIVAEEHARKRDWKETIASVRQQNLLRARTVSAGDRLLREVRSRLRVLTAGQLALLRSGSRSDQRQLLWLAACKRYQLLYEFGSEVIRNKFLQRDPVFGPREFDAFLESKSIWHPEIEALADSTRAKLGQVALRMLREADKRILSGKTFTNKKRHADIVESVKDALGNARMFVAASEVEAGSRDANLRIHDGFEVLARHTYPNLRMLRGITYTESNIEQCLSDSADGLLANDATAMSEAETEMLSFIARSTNKGIRVTVKALVEEFEKRPFGWYLAAILCTLAKLCGRSKIEARADSETLEDSPLAAALKNTRVHGNVVLEPQIEFTGSQIRRVKEFYQDFFDRPPKASEAKALGEEVAAGFQGLHDELAELHARSAEYPFLAALADPAQEMKKLAAKSFKFFFTEFESRAEKLLDEKETLLDPVRRFMAGPQAGLYADVAAFVKQQEANFAYVQDEGIAKLHEILADSQCYRTGGIQQAKSILDQLRQKVEQQIAVERAAAAEQLANLQQRLESLEGYTALPADTQVEIRTATDLVIKTLAYQTLVAVIRDTVRWFEEGEYRQLLARISSPAASPGQPATPVTPAGDTERKPVYVTLCSLRVDFDKPWLDNADDVARYIEMLQPALLREIDDGKRIQV